MSPIANPKPLMVEIRQEIRFHSGRFGSAGEIVRTHGWVCVPKLIADVIVFYASCEIHAVLFRFQANKCWL